MMLKGILSLVNQRRWKRELAKISSDHLGQRMCTPPEQNETMYAQLATQVTWAKWNHASFVEATGQACTGAVVRNHRGHVVVVVSSWCVLFDCLSAEEVEIAACCEGLRLVSQWCHGWNQITTQGVFSSHKISKFSITSITSPITSKH